MRTAAPCFGRQAMFKPQSLKDYGIDFGEMSLMLEASSCIADFSRNFASRYLHYRTKEVFMEKTPQNIYCISQFLSTFKNSYFIHIVRNPYNVLNSMVQSRRMPLYLAISTWLTSVSSAVHFREHPRVATVKYEDLTSSPGHTMSRLGEKLGLDFANLDIKKLHAANTYRKKVRHLKGWSVRDRGVIGNANRHTSSASIARRLPLLENIRVSEGYSRLFSIPSYSGKDVFSRLGYDLMAGGMKRCLIDIQSRYVLLRKFFADLLHHETSILRFHHYLKPIA